MRNGVAWVDESVVYGPGWEEKRQERLAIDDHCCFLCRKTDRLEVHHKPWAYMHPRDLDPQMDLVTLCFVHHNIITDGERKHKFALRTPLLPIPVTGSKETGYGFGSREHTRHGGYCPSPHEGTGTPGAAQWSNGRSYVGSVQEPEGDHR